MAYTTIDDPSAYFQVATWSGNGSNQTITNDGNSDLQPDWLWIKSRNEISEHQVIDSTRGLAKRLHTDTNEAETNDINATISSLNSDGFTMTQYNAANGSSDTGVGWQWKANGGTTSSNTDGTITSTVQANTTAGFSIVTFTGTGNDGDSYGHGLNSAPELVIPKRRDSTSNWQGYAFDGGNSQYWYLNLGNAFTSTSGNSAASSSSVITTDGSGDSNPNGGTVVSYCFHSVQGYSKIGRYNGNGNADGPFVYLGFKPAWLMIKRTDASSDGWYIFDSTRSPNNLVDKAFRANASNAESGESIDLLSNGFKHRIGGNNNFNNASGTYIYMAFAEHPFVSSKGVPTTAR